MDTSTPRPCKGVDRVALLDAFLEDVAQRSALRHTVTAPSPPTSPCTCGERYIVQHTDGAQRSNQDIAGIGIAVSDGDIRAVTSGSILAGIGSPHHDTGQTRDTDEELQAEILRVLDFLFYTDRTLVDSCVQVLDKSRVVKLIARDTRRSVWFVQGSRGAPYLCLREYCSCRSFQELIRRSPQPVLCKHLLAVRVAPALGVVQEEEVDDNKLAQRMSACDYG